MRRIYAPIHKRKNLGLAILAKEEIECKEVPKEIIEEKKHIPKSKKIRKPREKEIEDDDEEEFEEEKKETEAIEPEEESGGEFEAEGELEEGETEGED